MKFHEAANFLFDLRRFSPRPGTDATAALLEHLDDPHDGLDCIQIAGTNGKGSTARMVESTLREAGLSVGLYPSPHLDDVRERITVDGRPLSERGLCAFVEAVEAYVTDRINLLAVKLSDDLSDGGNPLFLIGDGSQTIDHFAVLTEESILNEDLRRADYGDLLVFENALVLWNDDEGAYNVVVNAETVVDRVAR